MINAQSMDFKIVIVTTTTDNEEEARAIGRNMVERRLAACAQISGPIESHFWWNDKLDIAREWQCRLKTSAEKYRELEDAIRAMHSYELPQIVAVPVVNALPEFIDWIIAETKTP